jgi:Methyltransferase domain
MSKMYVHYGCGLVAPKEWVNFDASFTLKYERTPIIGRLYKRNSSRFDSHVRSGDIVHGLPVPDQACRGVYASHVLEHLALDDFHRALNNTYRMLDANGVFRLVVPDLEWAAREYVRQLDEHNVKANEFFLEETCLGQCSRKPGIGARLQEALSTSRHYWMWDELSLRNALGEHGYRHIRRCHFGDAQDPMFHLVESPGRFEKAIAMEAVR